MYQSTVIVKIEKGIHARPSAAIVEYMLEHKKTKAWIEYPLQKTIANASNILEIMQLCVYPSHTVIVKADGTDEKEVVDHIAHILTTFKI